MADALLYANVCSQMIVIIPLTLRCIIICWFNDTLVPPCPLKPPRIHRQEISSKCKLPSPL
jgi:hypothetical protein